MTETVIGNKTWDFELHETFNGLYSIELSGHVMYKNVVFATFDISDDAFVGVYGFGDTREDAYKDAERKVASTILKLYPV